MRQKICTPHGLISLSIALALNLACGEESSSTDQVDTADAEGGVMSSRGQSPITRSPESGQVPITVARPIAESPSQDSSTIDETTRSSDMAADNSNEGSEPLEAPVVFGDADEPSMETCQAV